MTDNLIRNFWDNQAKEHGAANTATAPDSAYRDLEIRRILPHIKGKYILDVGCGNGYSTLKFSQFNPQSWSFTGMDFSAAMIEEAKQADTGHVCNFFCCDILNLSPTVQYGTIISERCLINLKTWEEQRHAIMNMAEALAPGGRIILVENFTDGLNNLNDLRRLHGLHHIETRWHNLYLSKAPFYDFVHDHFTVTHEENIGNLYYIISRVVYAALAKQEGKEPEYSHPINFLAAALPSLGTYDFSPNMLYVLERQ